MKAEPYTRVAVEIENTYGRTAALIYAEMEHYSRMEWRYCGASQATLAKNIGRSIRTVQRWQYRLEADGWIERIGKSRTIHWIVARKVSGSGVIVYRFKPWMSYKKDRESLSLEFSPNKDSNQLRILDLRRGKKAPWRPDLVPFQIALKETYYLEPPTDPRERARWSYGLHRLKEACADRGPDLIRDLPDMYPRHVWPENPHWLVKAAYAARGLYAIGWTREWVVAKRKRRASAVSPTTEGPIIEEPTTEGLSVQELIRRVNEELAGGVIVRVH